MRLLVILLNLIFFFESISGDLTPPDQKENKSWLTKNWVRNDEAEALCSGPLGTVGNVLIEVTDTEMKVSYAPPMGYENCDLDYKTVYYQELNLAVFQQTINKHLNQSYNYWKGRALCKLILLDITPIYNGVPGETYRSNQLTDKFTPHIDIGPIRNLQLTVTDILHITWWTPIDYDTCSFVFFVEIKDVNTGERFYWDGIQGFEYRYDYSADNNYCKEVEVIVESNYRAVSGGFVSARTRLGPPPLGSC